MAASPLHLSFLNPQQLVFAEHVFQAIVIKPRGLMQRLKGGAKKTKISFPVSHCKVLSRPIQSLCGTYLNTFCEVGSCTGCSCLFDGVHISEAATLEGIGPSVFDCLVLEWYTNYLRVLGRLCVLNVWCFYCCHGGVTPVCCRW